MRIDAAGGLYVAGAARDGRAPKYPVYSALAFRVITVRYVTACAPAST